MHTVFINTSSQSFDSRIDLLEIPREIRQFLYFDCPLSAWESEKSYESCALKLGEMIDSYKDINNDYNLIVYVDLLELRTHAERAQNKEMAFTIVRDLIVHYIRSTLYEKLDEVGRVPNEMVVLFERYPVVGGKKEFLPYDDTCVSTLLSFLGLPDPEELSRIVTRVRSGDAEDKKAALEAEIAGCCGRAVLPGVGSSYKTLIQPVLADMAAGTTANALKGCKDLLWKIQEKFNEDSQVVYPALFITDRRALTLNKRVDAKRNVLLQLYILDCVNTGTAILSKEATAEKTGKEAKPVRDLGDKWDVFIGALLTKSQTYREKLHDLENPSRENMQLAGMTPSMLPFAHGLFGLSESGTKEYAVELADKKQEPSKKKKGSRETADEKSQEAAGELAAGDSCKEIVTLGTRIKRFIPLAAFERFNSRVDALEESVRKNPSPENYKKQALQLQTHHLNYLGRLQMSVINALANYAGRGTGAHTARLTRRRVSVSDVEFDKNAAVVRYSDSSEPKQMQESEKVVAENAYSTLVGEYMKFCASRSVALTDIQAQCQWFTDRIDQVTESLGKIKTVAAGACVALPLLYIPYIVIQWESLFASFASGMTALVSLAVPMALLAVIFTGVSIAQRRQYRRLWNEFLQKSDEILAENKVSVEWYEDLLSRVIPALRYVYEYKLDVKFYFDCCDMAESKRDHHIKRLKARLQTVENILEDLECDRTGIDPVEQSKAELNYSAPFCEKKGNREFYSLVEPVLLGKLFQ